MTNHERPPLTALLESLLFVADRPVKVGQLATALDAPVTQIEEALRELQQSYTENRGLRLQRKHDQVQLVTLPEAAPYIESFLNLELSTRLSAAALETLAIIAYRQPVTRLQVESVRGVNCDGVLNTLISRELIEVVGRSEGVGRPLLYGTTFKFLEHFGLSSLEDLPPLGIEESEQLHEATDVKDEV